MSELKATSSGEIRARNALLGYWWYEKYETDKVISKLKESQRWREFSEEEPEHHQRILVCSRDYKTELRRWDEGCKFDVEMQEIYTHWMPLPKEPEE